MSRYFILVLIFSIMFGIEKVEYTGDPAILSYTDTPNEGRVRFSYNYLYGICSSRWSETKLLEDLSGNESYNLKVNNIDIDYFGFEDVGLKLNFVYGKYDYKDITEVASPTPDRNGIEASISAYRVWDGTFTFPINNIKTAAGWAISDLSDDSDADLSSSFFYEFTMDFILRENQIWSNRISGGIFSTMFIHNFSNRLSIASAYHSLNMVDFAVAYQLENLKYGYHSFHIDIKPSIYIPLPKSDTNKLTTFSLNFIVDFI